MRAHTNPNRSDRGTTTGSINFSVRVAAPRMATAVVTLLSAALVGCVIPNDDGSSGGAGGGGGSGAGGSGATTGGSSAGGGGQGEGGGGGGAVVACTEATVFSGSPAYFGEQTGQDPDGHPIDAEPPLRFRDIAFNGETLGVNTQAELWSLDTTAADPVYLRIAGKEGTNGYQAGPCGDALFGGVQGLAPLADGDWLVADFVGNALLRVTGAGKPDCQVTVLAGNAVPFGGAETAPYNADDVDGAGSIARFEGPRDVVTDAMGNAYFVDQGNRKLKKMANDDAHTVTTLASFDATDFATAALNATTLLGGHVYLAGSTTTAHDIVVRVATETGEVGTVYDVFEGLDGVTGTSANFNAMANDGIALLVAGNAGRVWRITTDGQASSYIAGGGKVPGLNPDNYDFTQPFPAKEAPMQGQSTIQDTMALHDGSIYWPSVANGTGFWLYEFDCK